MTSRPLSPWLLAAGRAINAAFFLTTSLYSVLTCSPFAYEQFIQPNMIAWLSNFVFLHTDFYWLALCVTTLTFVPVLRGSRAAVAAWAYLAVGAAAGVVMTFVRVLPAGNDPVRSVTVALLSLAPIAWAAIVDRLSASERARDTDGEPSRLLTICLATALFVWAIYAIVAIIRLRTPGGVLASPAQIAVGAGASLAAHLAVFTVAFLVISLAGRAATLVGAVALGVALERVVLLPIGVAGLVAWAIALAMAAAVVLLVSGISRHAGARRGSAMAEEGSIDSRAMPLAALALLPFAAFLALRVLTTFDWGFMVQKLSALAVMVIAFALIRRLMRTRDAAASTGRTPVASPLAVLALYAVSVVVLPRLPIWFDDVRLHPDFALDAYSAGDPSFRLLKQFLDSDGASQNDAAFFAYLRANTSIKAPIDPVPVDFVKQFGNRPDHPPHIFLFIIDSLRRDYVSVYNRAVTFTPNLASFARESVVFERAFSRYGGTGLSVPSIWAGAMVAHKEYVTPFAPMNALAKLLDADGYRRVIARDHITSELFGLSSDTTVLDGAVPEMMHTFCGTMAELKEELRTHAGDPRPIFAHARSLDLHIGNTRWASVPPGESYPGFFEPYAARVRRIDACFGDFVGELKRTNLYDDSIVIVMSDHGDSLGEGLRWGHGYTVVPEVMRIPLMIHLPASLRARYEADRTALAFATDVTPTLYALLGESPRPPRDLAGVPLFVDRPAKPVSRRHRSFLVASSYGAVYGLVRHNGRRLYIADAIEGRDYLYDLSTTAGDTRIGMTDADRLANRALVRAGIADLADWYGLRQP